MQFPFSEKERNGPFQKVCEKRNREGKKVEVKPDKKEREKEMLQNYLRPILASYLPAGRSVCNACAFLSRGQSLRDAKAATEAGEVTQ